MSRLEPELAKLGYSPLWIEYDLLDDDFLLEQCKRYATSYDKNTEHYRWAAFHAILAKNNVLDDTLIARYVQLAQIDEDQGMAESALLSLLRQPGLTDAQVERLSKHPAYTSPVAQRLIERIRLLRELQSSLLTEDLFMRCIASNDQTVQRQLLDRKDISCQQVELLRNQGANRAIRNIAKQRLHKCY